MFNVSYDVTRIAISGRLVHFRWNLQNSNVFQQLFDLHAPYIWWMFLVFNEW